MPPRISGKVYTVCTLLALIIGLMSMETIDKAYKGYGFSIISQYPSKLTMFNFIVFIVLLMQLITLVHELLHGFAFLCFGGKVRYGFKGMYAYTKEISGIQLSRTRHLIVLFAPLAVISTVSIIFGGWLGGLVCILNLLGSTGDVFIAFNRVKSDCKSALSH
jgi:hypothetical protein